MTERKIRLAVRTLVEHALRSGDLDREPFTPFRPIDALRAHQKIQKSRPPGYAAEVSVRRTVEAGSFTLEIGGRMDGMFKAGDRIVIEEIKTTVHPLETVAAQSNSMHWGQVKCYAYFYASAHDLPEIDAQLTYCRMDTLETREVRRTFTLAELSDFFSDLVERYRLWAEFLLDWRGMRDASIGGLSFPFVGYRPGQRAMAVEVYRTIAGGSRLILQAATGIGKTMATIFPAIKSIREGHTEKIFYLTPRTTGKTSAEKALTELRACGLRLKSITLTAKERICFQPEPLCTAEACPYARGYYDRLSQARQELFGTDAFCRSTVEAVAEKHRICPFEFSLDLSWWTDCIICDYNYAFDPRVSLKRFFQDENAATAYTFLIDEAHHLAERSREMFSAELSRDQIRETRRSIGKGDSGLYRSLGRIHLWMRRFEKKEMTDGQDVLARMEPPEALFPMLNRFLKRAAAVLSLPSSAPFQKVLLDLFLAVNWFVRVSELYDERYALCAERRGKNLRLKLFCIDPASHLEQILTRCRAAVFFSATLTPPDYFKRIFGCGKSVKSMVLSSPFPSENLRVIISGQISTRYRRRESTRQELARIIAVLLGHRKGNYLVFFPSYEYLRLIHPELSGQSPETETILQLPQMTESQRDSFLERFDDQNADTLAGLAVMGGAFGEGIDLVGNRLSAAVIVGVGLPGVCPERELIREYFSRFEGPGFEFAYLYPGINRVLQAAGRVIRSETDRGVVLLIDERYITRRYRDLLPGEWDPVRVRDEKELKDVLESFWDNGKMPKTEKCLKPKNA